jgi:hypothetical protein
MNYVKCLNKAVELNMLDLTRYEYNLVYNICSCLDRQEITLKEYRRMIDCIYELEYLHVFEYLHSYSFIVDDIVCEFERIVSCAISCFGEGFGGYRYYRYLKLEG